MPAMRSTLVRSALAGVLIAGLVSFATAAPVVYSGFDPGAGSSDSRPNAAAAASAFQSAISSSVRGGNNLEGSLVGAINNLAVPIAPDFPYQWYFWPIVSLSGTDNSNANQTIRNTPPASPEAAAGYNTSASGSKFISVAGGRLVLTFSKPFEAFGAYFTGLQGASGTEGTISFDDGATQPINLPGAANGGVAFVGFVNAGHPFTKLTITAGNSESDVIGVDDIRVAGPAPHYTPYTYSGFITRVERYSGSYVPANVGDRFTATLRVIDNIVPRDGDSAPERGSFATHADSLGTLDLTVQTGYGDRVSDIFFSIRTNTFGFNAGGEGTSGRLLSLSGALPPGSEFQSGDWRLEYFSTPGVRTRIAARDLAQQYSFEGAGGESVAFSVRNHGGTGWMTMYLPSSGVPAVESRSGGANGNHTIHVLFHGNVASGNASVVGGIGAVANSPQFFGNLAMISLTGVANAQTLTLALTNLRDPNGQIVPDVTVPIAFLRGDVNGDGNVNAGDATSVRFASGQVTDRYNQLTVRCDVNADGAVNSADALIVRSMSGTGLPPAALGQ